MNTKNSRGSGALIAVVVLGLLGVGGWGLSKTKWFHGDSKRADASATTTQELLSAQQAQGASAAAYVQTLGEVAATLPESREKEFIGRAGGIALSYLPKPDPQKIIEAQALKIAVLNGQLELANKLTGDALGRATLAEQRTAQAISAKRAADLALQEAAAEARGAEQQAFWLMLVAGVALLLWLYTKITHLSPGALSKVVDDIRSGSGETDPAMVAIDTHTSRIQQLMTKGNYKLGEFLKKVVS